MTSIGILKNQPNIRNAITGFLNQSNICYLGEENG